MPYWVWLGVGFFCACYIIPLPYYFHTSLKDLLLVCGSPLDRAPSVTDVPKSSKSSKHNKCTLS